MARVARDGDFEAMTSAPNWRPVSSSQDVAGACAAGSDRLGGGGRVGEQGDRRSSRGERGHRGQVAVAAMRRRASTVCTTNPAPARRVKSARHRGSPADAGRDAAGRDPLSLRSMARASTRPRPFIASGGPSACSRIARRPSSCRAIPSSWRRSATSSVCIWRRRIVPWFSVSTKRARSRPWTVPSPSCRCAPGRRSGSHD